MNTGQKMPQRRKQKTAAEKRRASVFWLCAQLGITDEARRMIAATFRADGQETMRGMGPVEMAKMEFALKQQLREKMAEVRPERLRQHRRMDGPKGKYAARRALYFLRSQAEILWGDVWEIELHKFIKRQTSYDLFWDSFRFPRDLHWQVTEGVKAMIVRAAKDPSSQGRYAEINARRRERERMKAEG